MKERKKGNFEKRGRKRKELKQREKKRIGKARLRIRSKK
jgi:hypothetical protein